MKIMFLSLLVLFILGVILGDHIRGSLGRVTWGVISGGHLGGDLGGSFWEVNWGVTWEVHFGRSIGGSLGRFI